MRNVVSTVVLCGMLKGCASAELRSGEFSGCDDAVLMSDAVRGTMYCDVD